MPEKKKTTKKAAAKKTPAKKTPAKKTATKKAPSQKPQALSPADVEEKIRALLADNNCTLGSVSTAFDRSKNKWVKGASPLGDFTVLGK